MDSDHPSQPSWSRIALDKSIDIEFESVVFGWFPVDLDGDFVVFAIPLFLNYFGVLCGLVDDKTRAYTLFLLLKVL